MSRANPYKYSKQRDISGSFEDRKPNFNAQTWLDARMFADICLFYQQEGLEIKVATILRDCVERVHSAICSRLPEDSIFISTAEAIDFLKTVGISTAQMERDSRARKKIGDSLVLEDRHLDSGGSMNSMRQSIQAKNILRDKGISQADVDRAVALMEEKVSRSTEEDRKLANADTATILQGIQDKPILVAGDNNALQRAEASAEKDRLRKEADDAFTKSMLAKK